MNKEEKLQILKKSTLKVEKFENYRLENHLSKAAFCKLCGISVATYNKILNMSGDFYLQSLYKLLKATNLHFTDVF